MAPNATSAPPHHLGTGTPRIGEMLVERGLVSDHEVSAALELQRQTGHRLGETLVSLGVISPRDLAIVLAERLGYPFLDLGELPLDPILAQRVPEDVARRYGAVPVAETDDGITVAMADPSDVFTIDDLRMLLGSRITPAIADPGQVHRILDQVWAGSMISGHVGDAALESADDEDDVAALVTSADEAPIVRLVDAVLTRAVDARASDIHIEPDEHHIRIRFRVDGVLANTSEAPLSVLRPLVSRLKIMGGLDIAKNRVPQDGRFTVRVRDRRIDVRATTLPTSAGEAVVLRLLDSSHGTIALDELGLGPDERAIFERSFRSPQGAILASGPTGSGKTTTLYASVLELNTPDRAIVSVEDPIEYRVDGVKQMQVSPRAGFAFATALRSILRADPDVILVGEIRDTETAKIAMEAALTGHLVLSTIHSVRAAEVPLRLVDMGVEPYVVSSSLSCAVGQRLVRVLCPACSVPSHPDPAVQEALGIPDELVEAGTIRAPGSCPQCGHTGYRGRTAIYEVLDFSEDMSRLLASGAGASELQRWAIADGMNTMRSNALARVAQGDVSVDEYLRVFA